MNRQKHLSVERRIEHVWYGESNAALLLLPFAWLFRLAVAMRRFAYRSGLLRRSHCGVPVIVVGNITVGGTGKTPLVAWIASRLAADGRNVGILSRGYGGAAGGVPRFVTADSPADVVGDEPLLLARQTAAQVCVGADRILAARRLVDEAHVDVIVCDDGMQHYRLERDLEIAVVDGVRGLGNGYMLPAGPLREPAQRLRDVDLLFVNGGARTVPGRRFELRPGAAKSLAGDSERDLDAFAGRRVWAVAGIGNPGRFETMLRERRIEPMLVDVPDHGTVSLAALRREASWPILMTAKDAVKYSSEDSDDAWYVPVDLEMSSDDEAALLNRLRKLHA